MIQINKLILLHLVTLVSSLLLPFTSAADTIPSERSAKKYHILIVHSYQFNLNWTNELNIGIEACIKDNQLNSELFSIHLDSKRILSEERHLQRLITGLDDYQHENIDLIITCDDAALSVLMKSNHMMAQNIPIVFCGVERLNKDLIKNFHNITGVTQSFDFANTFKTAITHFPQTDHLYIVTDNTPAGIFAREEARKQLSTLTQNIIVEYIDGSENITTTKLFTRLQNIPKESIVIMSEWGSGIGEEYLHEADFLPALATTCPVPIFTVESMNLGYGVIGGYVTNASENAYQATKMGIEILRGKDISSLPVVYTTDGKPYFDYDALERWNIQSKNLPENSIIINEPLNFFETYKTQIITIIIILTILILGIIFIFIYHLVYRRKILEKDSLVEDIQHSLIEQRNQLTIILNSMGDAVISLNNNNEITLINPVAMRYMGIDDDAGYYIGKDINTLLHITCTKKDCTLNKQINLAINNDGPVAMHENAILVPFNDNKETIYISGSVSRMIDENNNVTGVVIVLKDVTEEHKQKEELIKARNKALESDKLKTAFLANMSHEIRTPLNGIVGFANLLAEGEYEFDEKEQFIKIINSNCENLLGLITDILDLSRIESGALSFRMEECEINHLITNLVSTLQMHVAPGVVLKQDIPVQNTKIITDSLRLTQVLTNLANNAIKFTEKGSITIGYHLTDNDENIHFFVRDTGCGMAKEDLKNIFGRFYKKNEFSQGAGLGLAICDAIVEKFGGTIRVESEIGKGTVFNIMIPFFRSGNYMNPDVAEANIKNKLLSKRKKVILVAEDDDSNFKLIDAVLNKQYKIVRAWNGDETIEIFKTQPVDLILMDVKMPSKTGLEALVEIRKISTEIPIVMQTAYAFDTDKREAADAGCDDFITKPIQVDVLKATIKRFLETELPK